MPGIPNLRNITLRNLARIIVISVVVLGGTMAANMVWNVVSLKQTQASWNSYAESADRRRLLLDAIAAKLGYGGMIHDFKNLVLRGDAALVEHVERMTDAVHAELEELAMLLDDPAAQQDMATITETVETYGTFAALAFQMGAMGQQAEVVGAAVAVDDTAALAALSSLRTRLQTGQTASRAALLTELRFAIGYGGLIHSFKTFVLGGSDDAREGALAAVDRAGAALAAYEAIDLSPEERAALTTVAEMIDSYADALPMVAEGWAAGLSPKDIDATVKVDDAPAVAALDALERGLLIKAVALEAEIGAKLSAGMLYISIGLVLSTLIALAIVVVAHLALRRGAVQPAEAVADGIMRLTQGDDTVDLAVLESDNEIGAIARASEVFRQNMVRTKELLAEQERQSAAAEEAAEQQKTLLAEVQEQAELARQAEQQQEAARAAQDRIRKAVRGVVEAAVEGDFHRRIDESFDDPELAALADSVNRLMGIFDAAVTDIGAVAGAMARGDLSVTMSGSYSGALAGLQDELTDALTRISNLIEGVVATSQHVQTEVHSIDSSADDLSRRTETQAATLEESAAAIVAMTQQVSGVAANADEARNLVHEVSQLATHGGEVVGESVRAMDRIVGASAEISKVTSLIEEISFQTNLLALNAGVEAARAGESGRGFAVVASEVRALAQRSADAAQEISKLIHTSESEIAEGSGKVNQAGESIQSVVQRIGKVSEIVVSVADSTREQAASLEEINRAVNDLDHATQQNAAMFEETTASVAQLRKRTDDLISQGTSFRTRNASREAEVWDMADDTPERRSA
ncbi:methyl-accepting chemotaxis protein [Psychromarinibacter halotolerans]|uniref:Methyl-accepting chemotaxis protein n=1 Tax=Psychromarinibacter halotolerans TaxID=1775175 RepID=A0ABV7GSJ7_9RHOB|nr:methyl-accepting chemotaxis protein [Psychromarinibacter halotolerans]MDF0597466.1 methyl-accepting chemotaxis protein [Psychromarinibacter halotolerans]